MKIHKPTIDAKGALRTGLRATHSFLSSMTRHKFVLGFVFLGATGMASRAIYLQVVHKDFLQDQGDDRYSHVVEVPAHRGMMLDRNGEPLAVSSPVDSIWAYPPEFLNQREQWPHLATALEMTVADIEKKLAPDIAKRESGGRARQFVFLRRHMAPNVAEQIMNLKIPGVYTQREYRRYYPDAEVTSHLLGFTDIDDAGQEGLEKTYDSKLRGIPGLKRVIQDRYGRIVEDVESVRMPQQGQTVTLSIDRRIQFLAYRALKTAVLENNASGGAAVVADVRTGEVLAMVNQPAGNPNNRSELQSEFLRNRAVTDLCEPGSTVKPFTAVMGIESGKWAAHTMVNTAPMPIGRYMVRDTHNYGTMDLTGIIAKSSNVGVTKIALSLPAERLWRLYKELGFGAPSGMGISGEQPGVLRHFSKWATITHANHSFGYGFAITIMQLTQAYTVLAADGIRRPLTLLKREHPLTPEEERPVLAAPAVRQVRAMMEHVVSTEGTGIKASVPGYRVAGKTGTSRKLAGGHYTTKYFALFAGMVPATEPRLVMIVLIDEPKAGAIYGGAVAAPVFSATMAGALRILNITPDDMPTMKIAGTVPLATPTDKSPPTPPFTKGGSTSTDKRP